MQFRRKWLLAVVFVIALLAFIIIGSLLWLRPGMTVTLFDSASDGGGVLIAALIAIPGLSLVVAYLVFARNSGASAYWSHAGQGESASEGGLQQQASAYDVPATGITSARMYLREQYGWLWVSAP